MDTGEYLTTRVVVMTTVLELTSSDNGIVSSLNIGCQTIAPSTHVIHLLSWVCVVSSSKHLFIWGLMHTRGV